MKPLFSWPGSKRRLAPQLLPLFPSHTTYVEPFAGAAAMLFAKEPSKVEVLNDINGEVVNLYRVVQHHLTEFANQYRWALTSRQIFDWAQLTNPETLTDIQRAARWWYLQRNAFGGKATGQTFGYCVDSAPRFNLMRLEEDLSEAHLRLARVLVENKPWSDIMVRYDRKATLFFCDPPYWQTEGYGVDFPISEYEALAERMRKVKGQVVLTINDHPDMRRIFAGFEHTTVATTYTLGGAKQTKQVREVVYLVRR